MIESAGAERAVGIDCYATAGGRCHGRAKSAPDDFKVEEVISAPGLSSACKGGYLPLYRVEKRSIDTMHMVNAVAAELKSRVSYGGLKDSRAVAVQYVTPTSKKSASPDRIVKERFTATLIGYIPRPLSGASIVGNRFRVILRECCTDIESRIRETILSAREARIPNYFGLQRFGARGAPTHLIGKAMVMMDFEGAVRCLLERGSPEEQILMRSIEAVAAGEYGFGSRLPPPGKDVERMVTRELGRHPGEWIRALRVVPIRLRRLYVHAYQSFIYNKTISRIMARGGDISTVLAGDNWAEVSADGLVLSNVRSVKDPPVSGAVPMVQIVGYAYRNYGSRFDECIDETLESEGVAPGQFYIKEMQEVSSEGGFRRPHLATKDESWDVDNETATLNFTLSRGQYATVLLREILKPSDPVESGLV